MSRTTFYGTLIDGPRAAKWITDAIASHEGVVAICSAYLRADALRIILAGRKRSLNGRVLVRWQLCDLLSGASDLDSYHVAREAGLQLMVRPDFHGKLFSVSDHGMVVGSANATLSGLGLRSGANEEICTQVPASAANLELLERVFSESVLVDDTLFSDISSIVSTHSSRTTTAGFEAWPPSLLTRLSPLKPIDRLFTSECFASELHPPFDRKITVDDPRDQRLLGVSSPNLTSEEAASRLRQTRIFHWLVQRLERSQGALFFGALTNELHDALLVDPAIYRMEVKQILRNLFSWCSALPEAGIVVDRPGHSQRASLQKSLNEVEHVEVTSPPKEGSGGASNTVPKGNTAYWCHGRRRR
jgi:hypothetical protein